MSLTAGICEEAIFRGYLQRQFVAFISSAAIGISLSAVAFGAAHAYQGLRHAMQTAILGAMLGALAWCRKSVRAGMISTPCQTSWPSLFDISRDCSEVSIQLT